MLTLSISSGRLPALPQRLPWEFFNAHTGRRLGSLKFPSEAKTLASDPEVLEIEMVRSLIGECNVQKLKRLVCH